MKPFVASVVGGNLLVVRFEKFERSQIHPSHGLVELFNHVEASKSNSFLELEHHSPVKVLAPGESISAWQTWEVFPISPNATMDYIRQQLKSSRF